MHPLSKRSMVSRLLLGFALLAALPVVASAQKLTYWGGDRDDLEWIAPPDGLSNVAAVSTESLHALALKKDGTVVAWGYDHTDQLEVPAGLSGVKAVATGAWHNLALKKDGTVVGWGEDERGETSVPADLSGVTAIEAGVGFSLALKGDGTLVGWGGRPEDYSGEWAALAVPMPPNLTGVSAIAASRYHVLALKSDGTVVAWGANGNGESNVPEGLSGVKAVAAGFGFSVALKSDGTVVEWGGTWERVPARLSNVTAIWTGGHFTVAQKSDGTLVAWGRNENGEVSGIAGRNGLQPLALGPNYGYAIPRVNVSLAPGTVWGGDASLGTVDLAEPAPAGGTVVALSSDDAGVHVPDSVTVPGGETTAVFSITTDLALGTDRRAKVNAGSGDDRGEADLLVKGYGASVAFDHPDISGGSTTGLMLKVNLATALPVGARLLLDSSGQPLLGVPSDVFVPAGSTQVKIPLTTAPVTVAKTATATLFYGGTTLGTASLQILPMKGSLRFAVDKVASGDSVTGTVYLSAATIAPVTVGLSSSDPSVTGSSLVTVQAGERTANFVLYTLASARTVDATITATVGNVSFSRDLRITAATSVKSVSGPSVVYGNGRATYTVTLSRAAGPGGYAVALLPSAPGLSVPDSVTVPEGATLVTFAALADDVDAAASVTISARGAVNAASATVLLRPNDVHALAFTTTRLASGHAMGVTVTLKGIVAVDTLVTLASNDPLVDLPTSVLIPAGSRSRTVTARAGTTAKTKTVKISATRFGVPFGKEIKVVPL